MLHLELQRDDVAWLLGSLCQLRRIPFDFALVLQRFPPPYTVHTLIEAAQSLGFGIGEIPFSEADHKRIGFPCIGFLRPSDSDCSGPRIALLVKTDGKKLLFFRAGEQAAETIAVTDWATAFEPAVLLVAFESRERESSADQDLLVQAGFGYRWFATELLKHRRIWRDVLLASLFIQVIGLTTPLFFQVIVDKVVVHQTESTLIVIAVGLVMFMVFNAGMNWLRQYLVLHTGNRVDAVLGSEAFRHLLRLALPYFERRPTGTLVARLHAVETIREFLAGAAVSLLLDLPFLFIFLAVMFFYSWQLSLIAVVLLVLIAALGCAVTPVFRTRLNRQFLLGARNQAFLTEYVSGIETVKSLQMEPRLESRYDEYLASYLAAGFSTRQLSNSYNVAASALEQTMTILILCVGALLVMRNDGFTIGMLVAFQMFASRMSQPMLRLAGLWQEFQQASIAVKRLGDIMNAPTEPYSLTPSRAQKTKGHIEIVGLGFCYSPQQPRLFRNVNVALRPGRLTVLTGPSGSGKSTFAKLLLGFYQPTDGQILIDGRDIRNFSANELRQYYGVVPQETYLFSGTIYENLIAASPHAGLADVMQACRIAEIHDFIEKLPDGYNASIGEHGVGLSGGQKQRLAIARAVLKRPKILIFDEATSNLDQATAEQFARTINHLRGQVTILYIAHQLPKGLQVDEVFSLGASARRISVVEDKDVRDHD